MKYAAIALLLFHTLHASAQQVFKSPDEALAYARKHNPALLSQLGKVRIETNTLHGAWSLLLPQVKGFTQLDYNYSLPTQLIPMEVFGGPEGQFKEVQFGTKYNLTAGVEAAMPLIHTSAWMDVIAARQGKEAAMLQAKVSEEELLRQTARAFYAAVLYTGLIETSNQNLSASDTLLQLVELKYQNGLVDPLELNRVKSLHLNAQQAFEQNKTGLARALNNLKLLLGSSSEISVQYNLQQLQEPAIPFAVSNGSQVEVRQLALKQLRTLYLKEHLKRLPEISLYTRFSGQAQRNDFDFRATATQPWFPIGVLGIKAELPLFTAMGRQSQINKARIRYQMAELDLKNEQNRQRADDTELQLSIDLAKKMAQAEKQNYELAADNLSIALLKYREGLFSLDQYMNVWNETLGTQTRYLKSMNDYFTLLTTAKINTGEL